MNKIVLIILLMLGSYLIANAIDPTSWQEVMLKDVAFAFAERIPLDRPLILDIRAGDLSSALSSELKAQLLERNADIRELLEQLSDQRSDLQDTLSYSESETMDVAIIKQIDRLRIREANLVRISLELEWTEVEYRTWFSYRSERIPQYRFNLQVIQIPKMKLMAIDHTVVSSYANYSSQSTRSRGLSLFEPFVAALAVGSLIYLLWNTEAK